MPKLLLPCLLLLALLSACAPATSEPSANTPEPTNTPPGRPDDQTQRTPLAVETRNDEYAPRPEDADWVEGPAFVDAANLLVLESYPPQYRLALQGNLPTPCHQLRVRYDGPDAEGKLQAVVYSVADPEMVCAQMLAAFEVEVSLPVRGVYPPGEYSLWLDEQLLGAVTVAEADNAAQPEFFDPMKGMELYAWLPEGQDPENELAWRYSLVPGTNRVKDPAEILGGMSVDINDLPLLLATLPEGAEVFWVEAPPEFTMPTAYIINQVNSYCAARGLKLTFLATK